MKKKIGLAGASEETRKRVSSCGGNAPHKSRGLQSASDDDKHRVARSGGLARARDTVGLSLAGRLGGNTIVQKYGPEHFAKIGKTGGKAVLETHGHEFYKEIGKKGGSKPRNPSTEVEEL